MAFISNLGLAFRESVSHHHDRIALLYPATGDKVSYGQLGTLAEEIATVLCGLGIRQGDVVAVFHDKSPAAFATMLACLRLGVIYTTLDPESPWERVRKILSNCQPRLIVNAYPELPFREDLRSQAGPNVLHLRNMDQTAGICALPDIASISGATPAYIMFTSGSTGIPKGAVMSHANLLWFTQWTKDRFDITPDDVLTNVNPIYFDNSVFDFYTAIFSGATLVPLVADQVKDTRQLVRMVGDAGCTIWFSVPSLLVYLLTTRVLTPDSFPSIRKIIFGGEGFPKPKLKALFDLFGSRADLENVYGPTECTCICSAKTIDANDFEDMQNLAALGGLAQNFDHYIFPVDVRDTTFGELFLRGPQVGLGYFNDAERTSCAFVQNPNHSLYSDIGYRTGDLVQKDAHGKLHFKGRADFQIKHMGYRIELEEIESALNTLPEVIECAVIYRFIAAGMGHIVAFVATGSSISDAELMDQVAEIVPPYMLPKQIFIITPLPKNANGKIDRKALQNVSLPPRQLGAH